jgi:predicted DNA-binding protein
MSNTPPVGIRVPKEVLVLVDAVAERRGLFRSQWILEAVEHQLREEIGFSRLPRRREKGRHDQGADS